MHSSEDYLPPPPIDLRHTTSGGRQPNLPSQHSPVVHSSEDYLPLDLRPTSGRLTQALHSQHSPVKLTPSVHKSIFDQHTQPSSVPNRKNAPDVTLDTLQQQRVQKCFWLLESFFRLQFNTEAIMEQVEI